MGKEEEEERSPGLEGADMPGLSFLAMAPADMEEEEEVSSPNGTMWNVNGTANEDQIKNKNVSEVGAEKEEGKAPLGASGNATIFSRQFFPFFLLFFRGKGKPCAFHVCVLACLGPGRWFFVSDRPCVRELMMAPPLVDFSMLD